MTFKAKYIRLRLHCKELTIEKVADWNDDLIDAELTIAEERARLESGQPSQIDFGQMGFEGDDETPEGENPFLIDWENEPLEKAQEYARQMLEQLTN